MIESEIIGVFYIKLQTEINSGQGHYAKNNGCLCSPETKKKLTCHYQRTQKCVLLTFNSKTLPLALNSMEEKDEKVWE